MTRYSWQLLNAGSLRLDGGSTVAVVQPGSQVAAGQRVRVLTGPKGSRVEPA